MNPIAIACDNARTKQFEKKQRVQMKIALNKSDRANQKESKQNAKRELNKNKNKKWVQIPRTSTAKSVTCDANELWLVLKYRLTILLRWKQKECVHLHVQHKVTLHWMCTLAQPLSLLLSSRHKHKYTHTQTQTISNKGEIIQWLNFFSSFFFKFFFFVHFVTYSRFHH